MEFPLATLSPYTGNQKDTEIAPTRLAFVPLLFWCLRKASGRPLACNKLPEVAGPSLSSLLEHQIFDLTLMGRERFPMHESVNIGLTYENVVPVVLLPEYMGYLSTCKYTDLIASLK